MQSVRYEPCLLLHPFVECYIFARNLTIDSPPLRDKFIPSGGEGLVFHFEDPFSVYSENRKDLLPKSFFVGQAKKFLYIESGRIVDSIIIKLKPAGFYNLFSRSACELSNISCIDAFDIESYAIEMVYEKMAYEPDTIKRIGIIEQYLIQKLTQNSHLHSERISFAVDYIIANKGCLKIEALYELTNSCERTFQRDFQKHVGISAKALARLIRVNNIIQQSRNGLIVDWFDIIQQYGYFDQAHLIHDFKYVTGEAPSLFLGKDLTQTRIISASF
jgi:AraC-like DNA-binding protein